MALLMIRQFIFIYLFMQHIPFVETPIVGLPEFSKQLGVNLVSKRDDLFSEVGGGSKARMLQYIFADVNSDNTDIVVTAGGPCSNFNRACALMCGKKGIPMHLVEYSEDELEYRTSLNYFLCSLTDFRRTRCEKTEVADTIKEIIQSYKKKGLKVKYVYGGGRSLEGIFSYYEAARNMLLSYEEHIDDVFVACGTGTTLAGIYVGFKMFSPDTTIHAISIARTWDKEKIVLAENIDLINKYLGVSVDFRNLDFDESYLCGGYGHVCEGLLSTIQECVSKEGLLVDPTYVGKAFWGMVSKIRNMKGFYRGHNVLFWNTGGMYNLMSSRYLFE